MTKLKMLSRMAPTVDKKTPPKNKKPRLSVTIDMPLGNDRYCWKCHNEDANVPCTTCQRSFHEYCVPSEGQDLNKLVCTECMAVVRFEKDRLEGTVKGPLSKLNADQLVELLLCAVKTIRPYALDVFYKPVCLEQYPDYKKFVVRPFDLEQLERNVNEKMYTCVEQFLADLRWIHHNSVVFNGPQNRISSSSMAMLKAADYEIEEMALCPQCYLNMRKTGAGSFTDPCCPPHIIVWAKIRGFPHWPGKVMSIENDHATVKFFGDRNKSVVMLSSCTLLTMKPPVNPKSKKGTYNSAMEEINEYIKKYRDRFNVEFQYETENKKLTREMFENRMYKEFRPDPQHSIDDNMAVDDVKKEDNTKDYKDEEPVIKEVLISRVPGLLAKEEEDKDSGSEEQNSILESIKRKLHLDKKSESTDEDKEEDGGGGGSSTASGTKNGASSGDTKLLDDKGETSSSMKDQPPPPLLLPPILLGADDTPKSPERTNCAEVSSTTADTDPPTVIPKVANGDTFFEKLRQTIAECKEKVGVTELANLPAPADNYDESETDISDTELMPYQQRALASPKKDAVAIEDDKIDQGVQTASMNFSYDVHPIDKRRNQELVAREIALLRDKLHFKELTTQKAIWQANANRTQELIKSKQWCCVCKTLATMTCCWNTSYCSQTCQSSHWPIHIKSCERSQQSASGANKVRH